MKIDITKADDGTTYSFTGVAGLDDAVFEGRNLSFAGDVVLTGHYTVFEGTVGVKVRIDFAVKGLCDKCLSPFELTFRKTASPTYITEYAEETYQYTGKEIDLTKPVAEAVMLALPSRMLCRAECKGLCPKCGADKNTVRCGCGCDADENRETTKKDTQNNPFGILKSIVGGAKNGITQKKNK